MYHIGCYICFSSPVYLRFDIHIGMSEVCHRILVGLFIYRTSIYIRLDQHDHSVLGMQKHWNGYEAGNPWAMAKSRVLLKKYDGWAQLSPQPRCAPFDLHMLHRITFLVLLLPWPCKLLKLPFAEHPCCKLLRVDW